MCAQKWQLTGSQTAAALAAVVWVVLQAGIFIAFGHQQLGSTDFTGAVLFTQC